MNNRRHSLDMCEREHVALLVIRIFARTTLSFVAVLFLIWVAGGFR